jgi:hypothetical protein
MRPENFSRILNEVVPLPCIDKVKVRTPLNKPNGMPPDQTIFWAGENSVTFTGNARPGLTCE